jgi:hypothetical protein
MSINQCVSRHSQLQAAKAIKLGSVERRRTGRPHAILLALTLGLAIAAGLPILNGQQQEPSAKDKNLHVTVTVPARTELKIARQAGSIKIAQSDIDRGRLEMAAATQMTVKNNDRSGCLLLFEGMDWPFKKVLISGLDREVQISQPSSFIHLPYTSKPAAYTLSYSFELSEDAKPGEYRWPLSISLQPNP